MKLTRTLVPLLPLALVACASQQEENRKDVIWLVNHGRYDQALRQAARDVEADPDDPYKRELHREATVAYLLEQGRRATFEDRDEEALEWFERAEAVDDDGLALDWIDKTHRKLARRWLDEGDQAIASDDLEAARLSYENALENLPDMPDAVRGLGQVLKLQAYRHGLSDEYYQEAVRAQNEWQLHLARTRYAHARKYDDGNARAERRIGEVEKELSVSRTIVAEGLEQQGYFAAALTDFRLAQLMDPGNERARAGVQRNELEARAEQKLEEGKMALLRKDFVRARTLFEEGRETTGSRRDVFDDALAGIDDARVEARYQLGLVYEHDYRYPEAIEVYASILEERDFYQDVVTRLGTLRQDVQDVQQLYARVEASEDPAQQLALLRQIDLIWPDYGDVQERLAALVAAGVDRPAPAAGGDGDGATQDAEGGTPEADGSDAEGSASDAGAEDGGR